MIIAMIGLLPMDIMQKVQVFDENGTYIKSIGGYAALQEWQQHIKP